MTEDNDTKGPFHPKIETSGMSIIAAHLTPAKGNHTRPMYYEMTGLLDGMSGNIAQSQCNAGMQITVANQAKP